VIRAALALVLILFASSNLWAQAIVLRADDVLPRLKAVHGTAFFVNGHAVQGWDEPIAPDAGAQGLLLRLAALRLFDAGAVQMDEPLARFLPDILDDNPFKVALTLRHLLTRTSGFASPPGGDINPGIPLRSYAIGLRTPGQVMTDDMVGDAILAVLIEKLTGLPLDAALEREITAQLGSDIWPALGRVLLTGETADGSALLSSDAFRLIAAETLWRLHPMGPSASAVGSIHVRDGLGWLEAAPGIIAFPREGVVFMAPDLPYGKQGEFHDMVLRIARENFPPHSFDASLAEANRLPRPSELGGRYTRSDPPSAWLRPRLQAMAMDWMVIREADDGSLTLDLAQVPGSGSDTPRPFDRSFVEVAPYRFANSTGDILTLSPYRMGGYAYLGAALYHHTGPLGRVELIGSVLPWVLMALFSAVFHVKSKVGRPWRRMAWFTLTGTSLILFAMFAEFAFWPFVMYTWDLPVLVTLWRIGLNVGLMLILSVPLFALSFTRRGLMPERGFAFILAGPHLAFLSLAAMTLFLVTVALGLAGNFTAL
jgi:CubicO group peptidase (beta-lactamase class C family)